MSTSDDKRIIDSIEIYMHMEQAKISYVKEEEIKYNKIIKHTKMINHDYITKETIIQMGH